VISIRTSRTRAIGSRPPRGSLLLNWECPRAHLLSRLYTCAPGHLSELAANERITANGTGSVEVGSQIDGRVWRQDGTDGNRLTVPLQGVEVPTTFAAWVYLNAYNCVLCGHIAASSIYYLLIYTATTLYSRTDATYVSLTVPSISLNTWHRFVVTNDATTNGLKVYIDGKLATSGTLTGVYYFSALCGFNLSSTSYSLNGEMFDAVHVLRPWSEYEVWADFDPQTRWDLYWQPKRTIFLPGGTYSESVGIGGSESVGLGSAAVMSGSVGVGGSESLGLGADLVMLGLAGIGGSEGLGVGNVGVFDRGVGVGGVESLVAGNVLTLDLGAGVDGVGAVGLIGGLDLQEGVGVGGSESLGLSGGAVKGEGVGIGGNEGVDVGAVWEGTVTAAMDGQGTVSVSGAWIGDVVVGIGESGVVVVSGGAVIERSVGVGGIGSLGLSPEGVLLNVVGVDGGELVGVDVQGAYGVVVGVGGSESVVVVGTGSQTDGIGVAGAGSMGVGERLLWEPDGGVSGSWVEGSPLTSNWTAQGPASSTWN